ncbi:MAG: 2-C-methyl-D-erythritol 4-phosphate cytidylyltransferase [Nocardioides sp.]|nr:2-C-methyl-D-erythritol 4-phosphate cytidylyltransferase [Nocardioides sp.]
MDDEAPIALGVVVEADRGSWPFALINGEPLVGCAAWAMDEAGIQLLDLTIPWEGVRDSGRPLVWHDSLCPMTPPDFLASCVRRAVAADAVVAGVLQVTDTVKEVEATSAGPVVGRTFDRDGLRRLASPLVLPSSVVARMDGWPPTDFGTALTRLRSVATVELRKAPLTALRVASEADLARLEALTRG